MKRNLILLLSLIMLVLPAAWFGYVYFFAESDYGPARPPKDLTGVVVTPITMPMRGKTFTVPDVPGVSVALNLVYPTAKYDYPMGRFESEDGVVRGTLVALDDFTTDASDGRLAVPIAVNLGGSGEFYYLAVLTGENMQHATSLPIGDRIKITAVTQTGNHVSVAYLVHARNQPLAEIPTVPTTAIFDIAALSVIQAGRNPSTEAEILVKNFSGEYRWQETVYTDGPTVTPTVPDRFTLTFDANRLAFTTDCNSGSAEFTVGTGSSTDFIVADIATTKMFCESSQESAYFEMFKKILSYQEDTSGKLTFAFADDTGLMTFVRSLPILDFASNTPATATSSDSE